MFYLGIDQHAKQITINLRDAEGNVILKRQVSTRPEKILEFFEQLTSRCIEADCGFWAIVEVCGFNDWLIEMLRNFRCQRIVLIQPEESSRRKTDRRDAAKLSEDLWRYRHRIEAGTPINNLKIVHIPDSLQIQQRRLTNLRRDAKAAHTKSINRIKRVLRRHNLQHSMPTKTFPTKAALNSHPTTKQTDNTNQSKSPDNQTKLKIKRRQLRSARAITQMETKNNLTTVSETYCHPPFFISLPCAQSEVWIRGSVRRSTPNGLSIRIGLL